MVMSKAATVADYLKELPKERRDVIAAVRKVIKQNLPQGFKEAMNYGMICYQVPLKTYPETYNGQPLCYAGLAAQKNNYAVYLMNVYGDSGLARWFKEEFRKAGKKLDMGKSCVRFKKLDDLPLHAIAQAIGSTTLEEYLEHYEMSRRGTNK